MTFLATELPVRRGEFERLNFRDCYSNEPIETWNRPGPMAAASPEKDYGASFFDNSSEKENIFTKTFVVTATQHATSYWWKAASRTTITTLLLAAASAC
jgi:hypothetical protein